MSEECAARIRITMIHNGQTLYGGEDLICTMPLDHDADYHAAGLTRWRIDPDDGVPILRVLTTRKPNERWMRHAGYEMPRGIPNPGEVDTPLNPAQAHHHELTARKIFEAELKKLRDQVEEFAAAVRQ